MADSNQVTAPRPARPPVVMLHEVWTIGLSQGTRVCPDLWDVLSPLERDRAERFHFERDRRRFINAHGALRQILGGCLDRAPEKIQFNCGPRGKPQVEDAGFEFNLAHAEDLAVVVISTVGRVGIDLEAVRQVPEMESLVRQFFSANEAGAFADLRTADKQEAFFNLWTRKEAWLKATGEGIAHRLAEVEVSFLPHDPPALTRLPPAMGEPSEWRLLSARPAPGFVLAAAVPAAAPEPVFRCWNHEV